MTLNFYVDDVIATIEPMASKYFCFSIQIYSRKRDIAIQPNRQVAHISYTQCKHRIWEYQFSNIIVLSPSLQSLTGRTLKYTMPINVQLFSCDDDDDDDINKYHLSDGAYITQYFCLD